MILTTIDGDLVKSRLYSDFGVRTRQSITKTTLQQVFWIYDNVNSLVSPKCRDAAAADLSLVDPRLQQSAVTKSASSDAPHRIPLHHI